MTTEERKKLWPHETLLLKKRIEDVLPQRGFFGTGFEPADMWVTERNQRVNQLKSGDDAYTHLDRRLDNIRSLDPSNGPLFVRVTEGYSFVHLGPHKYNWEFLDRAIDGCLKRNLIPIGNLLHFGIGEWEHKENPETSFFQNPKFPENYADYAEAYAKRYPQVNIIDVANEPYPTVEWSTLFGWFNEGLKNDNKAFVIAAKHISQASILARQRILSVRETNPPIFIINESMGRGYATQDASEKTKQAVKDFNEFKKFIPTSLMFGHHNERSKEFLLQHGMAQEEYEWFMEEGKKLREYTVLGIDHYPSCISDWKGCDVPNDLSFRSDDSPSHFVEVIKEYCEELEYPVLLHMEFNRDTDKYAKLLFEDAYDGVVTLREEGYPMLPGITYFGDTWFTGWADFFVGDKIVDAGLFNGENRKPIADVFANYVKNGFPQFK